VVWVPLVVAGCTLYELDEVPIDGGTPEQRDAVRRELARFETWTGPGRVRLREIRFVDQVSNAEDLNGRYMWPIPRIELDTGLSVFGTAQMTRHELCHALDRQEDLARSTSLLDGVVDRLEPGWPDGLYQTKREELSEAMAELCDEGPATTTLLDPECPGDPPGLGPLADWFAGTVWTGEPDLWTDDELTAWPTAPPHRVSFAPDAVAVGGSWSGDSMFYTVIRADGQDDPSAWTREWGWLDVETGDEVLPDHPSDASQIEWEAPAPLPVGLSFGPEPEVEDVWIPVVVRGEGDQAVAIVQTSLLGDGLDRLADRAILWDADAGTWSKIEACLTEVAAPFGTADAYWWLAWVDDQDLWWAPVTAASR
jgi:hypothetical protein